jgi:hypothetical protein
MIKRNAPIRAEGRLAEDPALPGHVQRGQVPAPEAVRRDGQAVDEDGFSDHFPIGMQVSEAD